MRNRWLIPALLFMIVVSSLVLAANRFDVIELSHGAGSESCLTSLDPPVSAVTGVFVEPDDGYAPVLDEIESAQCEIALSMYLLSDDLVLDALQAADARGVDVKVQLEEDPFGGGYGTTLNTTRFLEAASVSWQWTPSRFNFSHAKYMVIDRQVAVIMNQNLTSSAFGSNREFGVISTDPAVVENAWEIFDADWQDVPLGHGLDHVVTSPENSREIMISMIDASRVSIDMYAEVIRDEAFIAALERAAARGVTVRLIENESSDPLDQAVSARLDAAGVQIRFSGRLYIHSKTMVFDGATVFVGSQNPTSNSFDNNREVGLVVTDPTALARCQAVFTRDWITGIPATPG